MKLMLFFYTKFFKTFVQSQISFIFIYIFLNRYSVYDLDSDGMYIVDLNISLCFESASPCALDVEVFKQTVLTKRECPKYTGFLQSGECQEKYLTAIQNINYVELATVIEI